MDVALDGKATGPCAGLRVIDFSTVVSGPMCTMNLGDMGADVIKVEPLRGDSTRMMGPPFKGELSALFVQFNRNKRCVAIDLKLPQGQEIARRLAADADVVVQNFRPGVVSRLGIDYATLSQVNPRLVYVSISGFGPDGPYVDQPAYDTVIQGLTGHMKSQGGKDEPALIRSLVADKATALTATYAVLAALLARERGGGGQHVEVPMLDAYAAFILPDMLLRDTFLPSDEWQSLPEPSFVHRTWPTADGHVVILVVENSQFNALCRVLGHEELIGDERFASLMMRFMNWRELVPLVEDALRQMSTATVVARARQFGAPLAPANGVREFLADPQVAANRTVFEAESATAGTIRYLRSPPRFSTMPAALRRHPPRFGEHTGEVMRGLGYGDADIEALRAAQVIA